jgi:peptidoglycan/LPS O-acetylase OafA/YrhL
VATGRDTTAGERVRALDGLRGIAAALVLVHHLVMAAVPALADSYLGPTHPHGFTALISDTPLQALWAGPAWVLVFFVLSGYVLSLAASKGAPFRALSYYPARFARLYFPVWGALILSAAIHMAVDRSAVPGATWWLNAHDSPFTLHAVEYNSTLVFGTGFWFTSVLWSLRWEVVFSVLLPLFLLLGRRVASWPLVGLVLSFAVIGLAGHHSVVRFMPVFFIGTLMAFQRGRIDELRARLAAPSARNRAIKAGLVLASLAGLTAGRWLGADVPLGIVNVLSTAGAAVAVLLPLIAREIRAPLERRPMQWIGSRSFSLYLVHEPVVVAAAFALGGRPSLPLLALVAVPPTLLLTEVFFRLVERPSHGLSRFAATMLPQAEPRRSVA